MANILELVKKLREKTQAGFSDCKKALEAAGNDLDLAVQWLREKGIAKQQKIAAKVAADGVSCCLVTANRAVMLEINTQTDFSAKSKVIQDFACSLLQLVAKNAAAAVEDILKLTFDDGESVNQRVSALNLQIGEKVSLRRVVNLHLKERFIVGYQHNNSRVSSLVVFDKPFDQEVAKFITMHVAALNPRFVSASDVDQTWLSNEKVILEKQFETENKPASQKVKIIEGRLRKLLGEVCLTEQIFIKEPVRVGEVLQRFGVKVTCFYRFEVGEGIEKVQTNFESEVLAQLR